MPRGYESLIICTTPRSGSTLLCGLLEATGAAGAPDSWFHRPSLSAWATALEVEIDPGDPAALARLLDAAIRAGTAGTGIFGLRLMRASLDFLSTQLDRLHPGLPSDAARLEAAFGRILYLHLRRDDKLAQAVSLVRATQTGLWHRAPDGTELERLAPPAPPRYDAAQIDARLAELTAMDAEWDRWFARERLTPLRMSYEALAADREAAVAAVLDRLGADPAAARGLAPIVAPLSDATSRDWIARFRSGRIDR